ncbi:MAG: ABC transporter ATP-binding protein [Chlamydiae bacterium]|nr:ABC transporter ATP-binding protein [Chlamydiota bacterium]MBI3266059.1 ABC transporter ATP-binding protein [Chlamydiota bacterium]
MFYILEVKKLEKSFGSHKVLDEISFSVEKGKILVILGMSGCGKSTLLKHLIGVLKPDRGEIRLLGQEIMRLKPEELDQLRRKVGILYQSAALFNSMTVGENVAFPLREHAKLDEKIIQIVMRIKLELVGLSGFENLMPSQISGGMKKRVGLARALALDPEIVFYDEPGAGLDPVTLAMIDQLILDLSRKLGITSVVVTHEIQSAFRIADQMVMMHGGKILAQGSPSEIRSSDNPIVRQFMTGSAEGPIPMKRESDEYLKSLMG